MMNEAIQALPLVAILRGIRPREVEAIARLLYTHGVRCIEVPLNSPDPFESIAILADKMPHDCLIGAGTVIKANDVASVKKVGGRLIVTPNTCDDVIRTALQEGMTIVPGVATPTDALRAWALGARCLKLFPASTYGPSHLKAMKAVLPTECSVLAVGGVSTKDFPEWIAAGAIGFGMASELFRPGDQPNDVRKKLQRILNALSNEL